MNLFNNLTPLLVALGINPNTGDNNAVLIWVVIALLAVSAAVLIYMGISSKNRKKKRKK